MSGSRSCMTSSTLSVPNPRRWTPPRAVSPGIRPSARQAARLRSSTRSSLAPFGRWIVDEAELRGEGGGGVHQVPAHRRAGIGLDGRRGATIAIAATSSSPWNTGTAIAQIPSTTIALDARRRRMPRPPGRLRRRRRRTPCPGPTCRPGAASRCGTLMRTKAVGVVVDPDHDGRLPVPDREHDGLVHVVHQPLHEWAGDLDDPEAGQGRGRELDDSRAERVDGPGPVVAEQADPAEGHGVPVGRRLAGIEAGGDWASVSSGSSTVKSERIAAARSTDWLMGGAVPAAASRTGVMPVPPSRPAPTR